MAQWNPTIALKTANEMLEIDRKENAIQVLNECLSGKKNKNQWQPILEEVITLLLDTCLKSQNYKAVKDGLHQYRTICFPTNSSSLEKVIYNFLQKGDALIRETKESGPRNTNNTDDESIESKILRSVTGDNYEERTERTHLQPYIKFLWESFRAILDLVRNRAKLELAYYKTAIQAMRFCVTYERKQEFKRIGEMLRSHFQQLTTHTGDNAAMITISSVQASPNSLKCLYGARFEYLHCSITLELWQEAFRTVEDLNEVMKEVKRQPSPQKMAVYFEKLAQLFWRSHNYVFHGYAWLRFYLISRDQNNSLKEEDIQRLASIVLVAALSVPVEVSTADQSRNHQDFFELNLEREKNTRLSALLGKSTALHREQLLNEICHHDIPARALPELRNLFFLSEVKFHPMELCNSLTPVFKFVQETPSLARYSPLLTKACFTRQIQQLSRVFQTMKIDRIYQLAPVSCPHKVEKLIVKCANSGLISARIDHRQKTLTFLNTTLESSNIKTTLFSVHEKLNSAVKLIQPDASVTRNQEKKEFFDVVQDQAELENRANLNRFGVIEDEKEKKETIDKLKARLAELKMKLELMNAPPSETSKQQKEEKVISAEEKKKIKARNQAEEKKIALQKKFNRLIIKMDYLERARREEEAPLLQKVFEEASQRDLQKYEKKTQTYLKQKEEEHKRDLAKKQRFAKMRTKAQELKHDLLSEKQEIYQQQLEKVQEHNSAIRAKINAEKDRLREEKIREEKEHRERIEKKKQIEEQRRKQDEEERRQREQELQSGAPVKSGWGTRTTEKPQGRWAPSRQSEAPQSTGRWGNKISQPPPRDTRDSRGYDSGRRASGYDNPKPSSSGGAWRPRGDRDDAKAPSSGGAWKPRGASSRPSSGGARDRKW